MFDNAYPTVEVEAKGSNLMLLESAARDMVAHSYPELVRNRLKAEPVDWDDSAHIEEAVSADDEEISATVYRQTFIVGVRK